MLFTSGTTGRSKGATLSHRNNLHWAQSVMLHGAARIALGDARPAAGRPVAMSASPMFHVGGLNCQLIPAMLTGGKIVYPAPGRWSEERHLELTEQHGATQWSLVPTQAWRLVDFPRLHDYDLSTVSTIGGGSAFWPPALIARLKQELPQAQPGVGYGMTETNGGGTNHGGAAMTAHPDSVGMAAPLGLVKVIDPDGEALPEGEVGEVCMRSARTFLGYWNNPEATTESIDPDGWYHTGDFGRIEGELLFLDGRRRDLIIRGGENIYPREIEHRLVEHPEIEDCAVIGVHHKLLGQEVKAFVVLHPGSSLDADGVRTWCGEALASFKVPTYIEFRDTLPYNAGGQGAQAPARGRRRVRLHRGGMSDMSFGAESTTDEVLTGIDLSGKRALVTGASTGLGKETARALAAAGASVVLGVRSEERGEPARQEILDAVPGADVTLGVFDLGSLASIREFGAAFAAEGGWLDLLINNAGVMATPFEHTADGFELQFGTNHLGHFALTQHLLPMLVASAPSRIVNLSSGGHQNGGVDFDDPNYERRDYDKWGSYGQAKSANILFTVELQRRYGDQGVNSYAVHPGMIATELSRYMTRDDIKALMERVRNRPGNASGAVTYKSVSQGAATTVWAATSSDAPAGSYLADCAPAEAADWATDPELAKRLWTLSEQLVGTP